MTLTHVQTSIECVIVKVFSKYDIPLDKIRAAFKAKLWQVGKCPSKLGGMKRQQQIQKWKEGKDSVWSLRVDAVEVTHQLLKRKQQVEELLGNEVAKHRRIESQVKDLKSKVKLIKKIARKQANTFVHLRTGRSDGGHSTSSKTWSQYSRQH